MTFSGNLYVSYSNVFKNWFIQHSSLTLLIKSLYDLVITLAVYHKENVTLKEGILGSKKNWLSYLFSKTFLNHCFLKFFTWKVSYDPNT